MSALSLFLASQKQLVLQILFRRFHVCVPARWPQIEPTLFQSSICWIQFPYDLLSYRIHHLFSSLTGAIDTVRILARRHLFNIESTSPANGTLG